MVGLMLLVALTWLAVRTLSRRRRKRLGLLTPLAGLDTGVRSPWRTPGRFFKPHKGF